MAGDRPRMGRLWDRRDQKLGISEILTEFLTIYSENILCTKRIIPKNMMRDEKYCGVCVKRCNDIDIQKEMEWVMKSLIDKLSKTLLYRYTVALLRGGVVVERYSLDMSKVQPFLPAAFEQSEVLFNQLEDNLRDHLIKSQIRSQVRNEALDEQFTYEIYIISGLEEALLQSFKASKDGHKHAWVQFDDINYCDQGSPLTKTKGKICEINSWTEFLTIDYTVDEYTVPETPSPPP